MFTERSTDLITHEATKAAISRNSINREAEKKAGFRLEEGAGSAKMTLRRKVNNAIRTQIGLIREYNG